MPQADASAIRWLIGVDGGGTGTRARLTDRQGRRVADGEAGPSALAQGVARAWEAIEQAIARAWASSPEPGRSDRPVDPARCAIGIGISGAGHEPWRQALQALAESYARAAIDTDIRTQLLGAFGAQPGGVISSGTGSFAALQDADGRILRSGGWGFPVGDEGSGAWIGLRAVRQAQAVLDGRREGGPLADAVMAAIGLDGAARAGRTQAVSALRAWCTQAGQQAYAAMAPVVFEAAAADPVADALLARAAEALLELVRPLQQAEPGSRWVVAGSVAQRLAERWPADMAGRLVQARGDACDGALELARRGLGEATGSVG